MRFMLGIAGVFTAAATFSVVPAAAQSSDESFHRDVLARLQRIEDRLNQLNNGGGGSSGSFVAAVDLMCSGYGTSADCSNAAKYYCKDQGFPLGLPAQDVMRGSNKYLIRVTCIR